LPTAVNEPEKTKKNPHGLESGLHGLDLGLTPPSSIRSPTVAAAVDPRT